MPKKENFLLIVLCLVLILSLVINIKSFRESFNINVLALSSAGAGMPNFFLKPIDGEITGTIAENQCREFWYKGFREQQNNNMEDRNRNWGEAAACDIDYVVYLYNLYPDDLELAVFVHQKQPAAAESWFWLGDLIPEKRLDFYMNGAALGSNNGRRWIELGRMLSRQGDLNTALQAFLQGCYNRDPGFNGCWSAGKTAEELGDFSSAIKYYRLSEWGNALDRAKELEAQGY